MKPYMSVLVNDTQIEFVHDRWIFDNILVAHEVAYYMKGKQSGCVGLEPSLIWLRPMVELNGFM